MSLKKERKSKHYIDNNPIKIIIWFFNLLQRAGAIIISSKLYNLPPAVPIGLDTDTSGY